MNSTPRSSIPRPGDTVAGKYRLERQLGAGGMGVVYAARHIHLNDAVALKMVLPEGSDSQGARDRFMREAQVAVKIRSEHVAKVHDLGFLESGAPYMAMELLRGEDLAELLRRNGPLSVPVAVDFVLQACEAIAEAHSLGMVHRDLKPANLFLTKRADGSPLVKVLDFGISKAPSADAAAAKSLTSTGALMGSPMYMSPEQVRDAKQVDHRCDVWAVGMILYELLTQRVAFDANTVSGLLASIVADPPVQISQVRPDIAPGLAAAIMRCLEKDVRNRTASIAEFAKSLTAFAPPLSQRSIDRVARLLPPDATLVDSARGKTAFADTAPSHHPPAMTPRGQTGPNAGSMGGGVTGNPAWGQTVPDPQPATQKRSGAFAGGIVGAVVVAALGVSGFVALRYAKSTHHEPVAVAASAPPPAAASVPAPHAAPSHPHEYVGAPSAPPPIASAAPAVTATATASAKKHGRGGGTKETPENKNGELGGAMDSRK